jgi:hypothetical protein
MDFGMDCTGCSSLIRNKLKVVKHVVWGMVHPSMDVVPLIKTINYVFNYFIIFYNDLYYIPLLYLFNLIS